MFGRVDIPDAANCTLDQEGNSFRTEDQQSQSAVPRWHALVVNTGDVYPHGQPRHIDTNTRAHTHKQTRALGTSNLDPFQSSGDDCTQ